MQVSSRQPITADRIRRAVVAACSPLGIEDLDVFVTGNAISIPSAGLNVTAQLSGGKRVWRAASRMYVRSVTADGERAVNSILFEEPFEREWQVARRIAMHIAETRIDAAIDAATA